MMRRSGRVPRFRKALESLLRLVVVCAGLLAFGCDALAQSAPSSVLVELARDRGPDHMSRLAAGARKEGSVVIYTTLAANNLDRVTQDFERRYGVKVQVWRAGSDKVIARALGESRANRFDVDALVFGAPELEALHAEHLLQEIRSPSQDKLVETAVPAHHAYAPVYLNLFAQAYNTDKVRKDELPRTLTDLLDPRWKGRLGIEAKDQEWFLAVVQDMGVERGVRFFQDLVAGNGLSVRNGHSVLTNLVASGEVPLALTVHSYMPEQLKRKGAPVDWFVLEPAVVRANAIGVARRAPHPHAALLFYEYMLNDAQLILADMAYIPALKTDDSPLRNMRVRMLDAKELMIDSERWTRLYESTLRGVR
ncbi:MAG: extracellular solute-binding protein [Pseudomonadota bacterium]|nr:extracellular solute-binding protein [Pseudomonadota bacterium]